MIVELQQSWQIWLLLVVIRGKASERVNSTLFHPIDQQSPTFLAPEITFVIELFFEDWAGMVWISVAHLPLTSICAAQFLIGHELVPVCGPRMGTSAVDQISGPERPHSWFTYVNQKVKPVHSFEATSWTKGSFKTISSLDICRKRTSLTSRFLFPRPQLATNLNVNVKQTFYS